MRKPDTTQFRRYRAFQVIPLQMPNATRALKDKAGKTKTVRIGKRPLDSNWTKREYNPAAVIKRCAKDGRNMGVRMRATDLVIDVDPRNGGAEGLTDLCLDLGLDLSKLPRVVTGSGGLHIYGRKPAGVRVVDTLKEYPGVEFKSEGRQVVAAGSVHPDTGKLYRFDPEFPDIDDTPMWPKDLLNAIERPQSSGAVNGGGQYSQEQIAKALSKLDPEEFRDHDEWLRLMMACHHASNGDAREEFVEWSTSDPAYTDDSEIIGRRWDSLHSERNDGVTYRTLNKILADHGAQDAMVAGDAAADFEGEPVDTNVSATDKTERVLQVRPFEEIQQKEIQWLWPGRFAVGKLSLLAGYPKKGKSQISLSIAAAVSNGSEWPNGEGRAKQGGVLILSSEDDAEDTIKPRLAAVDANMSLIFEVGSMVRTDGKRARVFNIHDDLDLLTNVIRDKREQGTAIRLVVLDPINAYFGGKSKADSYNTSDMRAILTPVKEWAAKMHVAVIGITHFNKGGSTAGIVLHRITDSQAITAAARSTYVCVEEPESKRLLFLDAGGNNKHMGGLSYRIVDAFIENERRPGRQLTVPKIEWGEPVDMAAEDVMRPPKRSNEALDDAMTFLTDYLADGPKLQAEVFKAAAANGHTRATIRRAKNTLGIESEKQGGKFDGQWQWALASPADDFEEALEPDFG